MAGNWNSDSSNYSLSKKQDKTYWFTSSRYATNDHQYALISNQTYLKSFTVGKAIVLKNIFFDFNKAYLREQSKIELDRLVRIMKDNPKIRIELSARTDSVGSAGYNLKLLQLRAQSYAGYLMQI
ncbi:MAG: OmpA family protein [Sphingobacteriaceae bacterium]|nr:MAG: OmpA family protein [Sphingobacteriaceae bacterium]